MNHLIRIEQRAPETQDVETGALIPNWDTFRDKIFCNIEALSARDFMQSRADQSDISVRITIPHIRGLDSIGDVEANMRVIGLCKCHEGRIYNPKGVLEDNFTSQEYVTVPCSQGVNEG